MSQADKERDVPLQQIGLGDGSHPRIAPVRYGEHAIMRNLVSKYLKNVIRLRIKNRSVCLRPELPENVGDNYTQIVFFVLACKSSVQPLPWDKKS